jgi:ParB/RepB/Spo0J family partition protein
VTKIIAVDTNLIDAEINNREHFDQRGIESLAASIHHNGQKMPVILRAKSNGRYQLVAGERRTRACKFLGIDVLAVIQELTDKEAYLTMLLENNARQDTNPVEDGRGYQRAISDYGLTPADLAEKIGKRVDYVERRLELLKLLPEYQELAATGQLSIQYAQALTQLRGEYQQAAMRQLEQSKAPTVNWFREVCSELAEKQNQLGFDFGLFGGETAVNDLADSVKVELPADPDRFAPTFNGRNMPASCKREIKKWKGAALRWAELGNKQKSKASGAIVQTLEAMLPGLEMVHKTALRAVKMAQETQSKATA